MPTDTEVLLYKLFHLSRCIYNILTFILALIFILAGCFHQPFRSSKRQWLIFNTCITMLVFAIIDAVFSMLPVAPTYFTVLIIEVCTLQNYLLDAIQGHVAYSFLAFAIHQIGPQEWRNRSFIWFGMCVCIQWLCSYLLPLPQILMANLYTCFGYLPNQFFTIYSLVFLFILPVVVHVIVYMMMHIFKVNETTVTQIYPAGHTSQNEINYRSLMNYILIMGLLFSIIGYGPKSILAVVDPNLQQSVALYAALDILPALCLLININLLFVINKEIRKKIKSVFIRS